MSLAAAASHPSHEVRILRPFAYCQVCGTFGASKVAMMGEACPGKTRSSTGRKRLNAMRAGRDPCIGSWIGESVRFDIRMSAAVCPVIPDEPEREQEAEVNLELVAEELQCREAGSNAAVAEAAAWLKRTRTDPRTTPRARHRRGPRVKLDLSVIDIVFKAKAQLRRSDLKALQSFPAQ